MKESEFELISVCKTSAHSTLKVLEVWTHAPTALASAGNVRSYYKCKFSSLTADVPKKKLWGQVTVVCIFIGSWVNLMHTHREPLCCARSVHKKGGHRPGIEKRKRAERGRIFIKSLDSWFPTLSWPCPTYTSLKSKCPPLPHHDI